VDGEAQGRSVVRSTLGSQHSLAAIVGQFGTQLLIQGRRIAVLAQDLSSTSDAEHGFLIADTSSLEFASLPSVSGCATTTLPLDLGRTPAPNPAV
jgi:hypothetical protein